MQAAKRQCKGATRRRGLQGTRNREGYYRSRVAVGATEAPSECGLVAVWNRYSRRFAMPRLACGRLPLDQRCGTSYFCILWSLSAFLITILHRMTLEVCASRQHAVNCSGRSFKGGSKTVTRLFTVRPLSTSHRQSSPASKLSMVTLCLCFCASIIILDSSYVLAHTCYFSRTKLI